MEETSKKIRIMLVDDHQMIIDSLRLLFNLVDGFDVVCTEHDSRKVMDRLENNEVDVLITDLRMPYLDGLQLTMMVKEKYPDHKVLLLSVNEDPSDIKDAYHAGASGYVMKKASRQVLEEAVKEVAQGRMYFGQDALKAIFDQNQQGVDKTEDPRSKLSNLTKREIEIVKLLIEELSSVQIAELLHISPGTVETHRHNILRKLNVKSTIGVVKFALRAGIVK